MATRLVRGTIDGKAAQWTEGAITVRVAPGGSDTATVSRRDRLLSGDYSAFPFATLAGALAALPKGLNHDVLIDVLAGTYDGAVVEGFVGRGRLRIMCETAAPTIPSGVTSGIADSGTTTTVMVKPAAAANWTVDTLRGYYLVITAGGGESGDPDFPTVRVIKSNTTTTLTVDPVPGMDDSTTFEIAEPAVTLDTDPDAPTGFECRLGFLNCTADVGAWFIDVDETGGDAGVRASRCDAVELVGIDGDASSGNAVEIANCEEVAITAASFSGPVSVTKCGWVQLRSVVSTDAGGITVDGAQLAEVQVNADAVSATAVLLKNLDQALLGLVANDCTSTPCVLQNIRYFAIAGSLAGTNAGATHGVSISRSGQYVMTGATLSGAADFLLEGFAGTWADLSSKGAYVARGGTTAMHWGSGLNFLLGVFSIESDLTIGGTFKNFGINYAPDPATKSIVAAASGTQVDAAIIGYQDAFVTAATNNASIIFPYVTVGGTTYQQNIFAAGASGRIWNLSAYIVDLYPALVGPVGAPTGVGTINGQAANVPLSLPPGCLAIWESDGDNTYRVQIVPQFAVSFKPLTVTTNQSPTLADVGTGYNNSGAGGAVAIDLPAPVAGARFHGRVAAGQYLRFTASTGVTIYLGGTASATAGYIRSNTVGSTVTLEAVNSTTWVATSLTGTWLVDA